MTDKEHQIRDTELEKGFYEILANGTRKDAPYDYLMLFSAGKDSSYLAHKLKQAKGGRVCLFTVENGFEEKTFLENVKNTAEKLDCDLYIYQPPSEQFIRFYRYLITEPALREIDTNPLCFFCGRYFMALGTQFAERMNIPFVFYGATPQQINKGQRARSLRDIEIHQLVSRRVQMEHFRKIKSYAAYQEDPILKDILDTIFYFSNKVKAMFPFQFLCYDVDYIKKTLEKEYAWTNPSEGLSNQKYLTSGCSMVELFGVLSRKFGFIPHELEQFKRDYESGGVSRESYEFNRDLLEEIMNGEKTERVAELARRLGLEKELQ